MMSSITSTSAATTLSPAITMTTEIGLGVGGLCVAVALIFLLSSKELLYYSKLNSQRARKTLNYATIPFILVFILNVAFMLFV